GSFRIRVEKEDGLPRQLDLEVFLQPLQDLFPLGDDSLHILLGVRSGEIVKNEGLALSDLEGRVDPALPLQPLGAQIRGLEQVFSPVGRLEKEFLTLPEN